MSKNLIDREKLLSKLRQWPTPEGSDFVMEEDILFAPTVDAVLVRRGKWNKQYSSGLKVEKGYVSSCCDMWNERRSNFCPNCGADMREVDNE